MCEDNGVACENILLANSSYFVFLTTEVSLQFTSGLNVFFMKYLKMQAELSFASPTSFHLLITLRGCMNFMKQKEKNSNKQGAGQL